MPPDAPRLAPAIARAITTTGVIPEAVTADRGYGQTSFDEALADLGVDLVAILRKGQPGKARQQVESADNFVELVKWRTGAEGRIAAMKRQHGWDEPGCAVSKAHEPGAAVASSATTRSRSLCSPTDDPGDNIPSHHAALLRRANKPNPGHLELPRITPEPIEQLLLQGPVATATSACYTYWYDHSDQNCFGVGCVVGHRCGDGLPFGRARLSGLRHLQDRLWG